LPPAKWSKHPVELTPGCFGKPGGRND